MTETMGSAQARLQGSYGLVIEAPSEVLWRLISDSSELPRWGPPVTKVEVYSNDGQPEALGTARKVHAEFGRRSGYFLEHRVEHVPGRKVAYLIDEENFGLARLLSRPGFSLELQPQGDEATLVVFSFFHDTRGFGRILNPIIKLRQRRDRRQALTSLKMCAEQLVRS
jgi:uncharacterized protein YndB with AHSA1/START domain